MLHLALIPAASEASEPAGSPLWQNQISLVLLKIPVVLWWALDTGRDMFDQCPFINCLFGTFVHEGLMPSHGSWQELDQRLPVTSSKGFAESQTVPSALRAQRFYTTGGNTNSSCNCFFRNWLIGSESTMVSIHIPNCNRHYIPAWLVISPATATTDVSTIMQCAHMIQAYHDISIVFLYDKLFGNERCFAINKPYQTLGTLSKPLNRTIPLR